MKRVLSTKKLEINQRELLLNSGLSFVDYDAIDIQLLQVEIPKKVENAIFTSQNAVRSILKLGTVIERCFCVGKKTEMLLVQNGYNVVKTSGNSTELGDFVVKNHKKEVFYYFCGSRRRDELPDILNASEMSVFELKTYKTELKRKEFNQKWDGILFFSPSGVESYYEANFPIKMEDQETIPLLICIGETTASEAKKYSNNIVLANTTTVESVIAKAVKILKNT